ncbi:MULTISPECIES: wax ester/triacylglycerol synthase domain-containing protein [unclassified Nocardia]|uniref:wax ester/triacylglycerol synthase domain-containing protein n=1 Tax=unclassified Nocardia TaxID=2637762 RepID=UPI0033AEF5B1
MTTMAARDATMFWLSRRGANDVFLLYCFAENDSSADELRAFIADRSARIPDLRIRIREIPGNLDYPRWEPAEFTSQQFVYHRPDGLRWPALLDRVGELLGTGVDGTESPWRIHVFRAVLDAPAASGPLLVVVLQVSHALADGTGAAALARALFAPSPVREVIPSSPGVPVDNSEYPPVEPVKTPPRPVDYWGQLCAWTTRAAGPRVTGVLRFPRQLVTTARRGRAAQLAQRELVDRTAAGAVPAPTTGFAPNPLNPSAPVGVFDHRVRLLVVDAARIRVPGRTVTVVALTAVSHALAAYLAERGEHPDRLGTALPMALPGPGAARNHYRGLSIDLHIDEPDLVVRAGLIADDLATRRERALNPLLAVQDRVGATVPAVFAARDVARADLDSVPAALDGNTVVSSVYRGDADLTFAGAPVLFTGGFPALGAVMHLTHGVHGIGETIALSVHSDVRVLSDPDRYLALLAESLDAVVEAHRANERG